MPVPHTSQPERALLRESAYTALRAAIVDGTLAPGERLRDAELEGWLRVSRTPIREALSRLEQAGLVQTKPGRSTVVAPLDLRATRNAQAVVSAMHELAVREAVPTLSAAQCTQMRHANTRFAAALKAQDADAALTADDELHGVLIDAAANTAIRSVIEQFGPVLRRVERLRFSSLSGRRSVTLHDRIIELCEAGDAEGAALATRANWLTLEPLLNSKETP